MDTQKLRVRIGNHEFEAEGDPAAVSEQFQIWRDMVSGQPVAQPKPSPVIPAPKIENERNGNDPPAPPPDSGEVPAHLAIFRHDRKGLSLNVQPMGERRIADAVMLLLYGQRHILGAEAVPASELIEGMKDSGLSVDRLDKQLASRIKEGTVIKTGKGRGCRYRLANTGMAAAELLAIQLHERIA